MKFVIGITVAILSLCAVSCSNSSAIFSGDEVLALEGAPPGMQPEQQVLDALHAPACPGKPRLIHLHTLKGKGVSFMENQCGWHGVAPNDEQYKQAMAELEAQLIH